MVAKVPVKANKTITVIKIFATFFSHFVSPDSINEQPAKIVKVTQ